MPGLNGMRAIAVTAVVWHHSHPGIAELALTRRGFLGVDIFFVLSGFLITTLLLRERAEFGAISLRQFYVRRTLRIFPLYYAVLLALAAYFTFARQASEREAFFAGLPFYLTYTSNWFDASGMMSITWSLSAEEQFYLLWPPLLLLLGRWSVGALVVFLALNQAVNFGLLDAWLARIGMPYSSLDMLQCTFAPIILGVLLAFGIHNYRAALMRFSATPILIAAAVVMFFAASVDGDIRGWPRLAVHLATVVLLAGIVLRPQMRLTRALEWRPIAYVGAISYGIYLLHMMGVDAARRILTRFGVEAPEALFALALLITIGIAGASFKYFETPLLNLRQRFRKTRAAAIPAGAPVINPPGR